MRIQLKKLEKDNRKREVSEIILKLKINYWYIKDKT